MGIARSADAMIIQITLTGGRSNDQKKALYKAIAGGIHAATGLRIEDVFIGLVEVVKEDWSYGNGIGQLIRDTPAAPKNLRDSDGEKGTFAFRRRAVLGHTIACARILFQYETNSL